MGLPMRLFRLPPPKARPQKDDSLVAFSEGLILWVTVSEKLLANDGRPAGFD
jgi:hypothetical protein